MARRVMAMPQAPSINSPVSSGPRWRRAWFILLRAERSSLDGVGAAIPQIPHMFQEELSGVVPEGTKMRSTWPGIARRRERDISIGASMCEFLSFSESFLVEVGFTVAII